MYSLDRSDASEKEREMSTETRRDRRRKAALERLERRGRPGPGYRGGCVEDGRLNATWGANGKLGITVAVGPFTTWVELTPERATEIAAYILSGLPAGNSQARPA
jgi:hypothetical protein